MEDYSHTWCCPTFRPKITIVVRDIRCIDVGDLATTTDPVAHTTTRTYDEVSRLLMQIDPLGQMTWYTYDAGSRLTQVDDTADPR